tara:strand:+ start:43 stop:600 length:558 start_codon:yes stop_codon:yes gene_type:complete
MITLKIGDRIHRRLIRDGDSFSIDPNIAFVPTDNASLIRVRESKSITQQYCASPDFGTGVACFCFQDIPEDWSCFIVTAVKNGSGLLKVETGDCDKLLALETEAILEKRLLKRLGDEQYRAYKAGLIGSDTVYWTIVSTIDTSLIKCNDKSSVESIYDAIRSGRFIKEIRQSTYSDLEQFKVINA